MRITIFIFTALISILSNNLQAQLDDNIKAKLYFTEAEKLFKQGDFKASRGYVEKAENALGTAVARTSALKIKIAYNLGEFTKAKQLFDDYTNNYMKSASEELNDEVLALFIDIEEAVEAENNRLYITVNGRKLEIYKEDLVEMNWADSKKACINLGSGWRLPTKVELKQMYEILHQNGKGNFKSAFYWSSTEGNDLNYAWGFYFLSGYADYTFGNKQSKGYIRAVRTL